MSGDDYKHTGGGFMGKKWDSFVPGPNVWREVYRCLKPGGYALVFAGSRTQDLMTTSLRLAGFEIRDVAMWLYGSGFPKSLDVSKAVEKTHGVGASRERALQFTKWMRSTGITAKQINDATGSDMGSHYLTDKQQPAVATLDMYAKLAHLLPEPPLEIRELMEWRTVESENMKRRKILETKKDNSTAEKTRQVEIMSGSGTFHITDPHTEAAKQWEGWGTALKPAYEPVIIARKPLEGTVADNVLTYGTGAINIDGCRIETADRLNGYLPSDRGRWPANVMHDGLSEDWARYFYCPKTSKADRNAGLGDFEPVSAGEATGGRAEGSAGLNSPRSGAGRTGGNRNHHPTVKPTELMRYLCRLVTPPGGLILDPFSGSGSTGRGAILEGFNFVGFEMDPDYTEIANARIYNALLTRETMPHNMAQTKQD